jgi:hypothetical protein
LLRDEYRSDETCVSFTNPALLKIFHDQAIRKHHERLNVEVLINEWMVEREVNAREEGRALRELDDEVYDLYGVRQSDRDMIERELARRPRAEGGYAPDELAAMGVPASTYDESDTIGDRDVEVSLDPSSNDAEDHDELYSTEDGDSTAEDDLFEASTYSTFDLVARLLSHYVKQTLEGDDDGIVPVAPTHGDSALIVRLREAITKELGSENACALEAQCPPYLGTETLAGWLEIAQEQTVRNAGASEKLTVGFFPWHVATYRSRPIFWLLSSENFERIKNKSRFTFRAYLHYLKLTSDTLPRLLSYYLDPEIDRCRNEYNLARDKAASAEGKAKRKAETDAQEWLNTVDSLRRFREALEGVIKGPPKAEKVPEKAKWLQRTIAAVRGGQDIGHGYQPNIDFGVRVNITPLAEAKLLPRLLLKRLGG